MSRDLVMPETHSRRVRLANPILDEEMKEAALQAFQNEHFVGGESVHKFEEEFASYCGTKYAVSTASGTAALTMSLVALGARNGQVLTSPASFVATANSIIHAGATPRFADINMEDYNIDPAEVRKAIGKDTKALLPVHLFGYPAKIDQLREITLSRGTPIIEDACQAHGASYKGKRVGSLGDVGCFSFYPSKNMTVGGDGGMITTDNESIAESVTSLRNCGRAKESSQLHRVIGFTERLNTVQAAIGRVQLRRLDAWNQNRRIIASKYDELLSDLKEIVTPPRGDSSVHHLYVIRCQKRDELRAWLDKTGIETGIHYLEPIHLQPIYRELFNYREGEFPNSELLCRSALSIPIHPALTAGEVEFVSGKIHEFYDSNKK